MDTDELENARKALSWLLSYSDNEGIQKLYTLFLEPPSHWDLRDIAALFSSIKNKDGLTEDESRCANILDNLFEITVKLPSHKHPLRWRMDVLPNRGCSGCNKSHRADKQRKCYYHYHCPMGGCPAYYFHPDCAECLPEIRHPYDRKHPLTRLISGPPNDANENCPLCGDKLGLVVYHCSVCNFGIHPICACEEVTPLALDYKKGHEHTLTLWLKDIPFTCDACGQFSKCCPYVCLQCYWTVHRDCIYLLHIIKITRHQHRLSLVYSRFPKEQNCGVCRLEVQRRCGQYLCNKGCDYAIHSKCATNEEVWDGKELEGAPEETDDVTQDLKPFQRIDDKTIQHFSHGEHHLRLEEQHSVRDPNKLCKACILPIHFDPFYSCTQCDDFALHERCASLPRKKSHALHLHPLTLHDNHIDEDFGGTFNCFACGRLCSGFKYRCHDCADFEIDIQCASIPEPFINKGHPHPLFITPIKDNRQQKCGGCGRESDFALNCVRCSFSLCFKCATLPRKIMYKHDKHFLILRCGEDANGPYWCEICEAEINLSEWFYTCEDCGVTLHVGCSPLHWLYLMPGARWEWFEMVRINQSSKRPVCCRCRRRCPHDLAVKDNEENCYFCSYNCLDF